MTKLSTSAGACRKSLTRSAFILRKLVADADYYFHDDRLSHFRARGAGMHKRSKGKLYRALALAAKHAKVIGDAKLIDSISLLYQLARRVVSCCDFFTNGDIDARPWPGQPYLAEFDATIADVKRALHTAGMAA